MGGSGDVGGDPGRPSAARPQAAGGGAVTLCSRPSLTSCAGKGRFWAAEDWPETRSEVSESAVSCEGSAEEESVPLSRRGVVTLGEFLRQRRRGAVPSAPAGGPRLLLGAEALGGMRGGGGGRRFRLAGVARRCALRRRGHPRRWRPLCRREQG
jgi:hypothetical protein